MYNLSRNANYNDGTSVRIKRGIIPIISVTSPNNQTLGPQSIRELKKLLHDRGLNSGPAVREYNSAWREYDY